jgi:hypothetical protein
MDFKRKGRYKVYANDVFISQHDTEYKALIKAANQSGKVHITFPDRFDLIRSGENKSRGILNSVTWQP